MLVYRTMEELEAGLENILQAPQNAGVLELIVRRPQIDARELLDAAEAYALEHERDRLDGRL